MKKIKSICTNCHKNYFCKEACTFLIKMQKEAQGVCLDCHYYGECKKLCYLAQAFVNGNSRQLHELKENHDILVIHSENDAKVNNFSAYATDNEKGEEVSPINFIDEQAVNDFWDGVAYKANTLKLAVFIDRFFNKMSPEAIAIKYDITIENVGKNYQKGKQTLFHVIDDMNHYREKLRVKKFAETAQDKMDKLPNGVKAFLLRYVFDLNNADIAQILGITASNVCSGIRPLKNDVKAGVNIIKFDEDLKPVPVSKDDKFKDRQKKTQGTSNN